MKQVLHEAGITNYSIWNIGDELFGYYECQKGIAYAFGRKNDALPSKFS